MKKISRYKQKNILLNFLAGRSQRKTAKVTKTSPSSVGKYVDDFIYENIIMKRK